MRVICLAHDERPLVTHHSSEVSSVGAEASSHLLNLVRIARTHPSPIQRAQVARIIGSLPLDLALLDEVQALQNDPVEDVREAALAAGERLGFIEIEGAPEL